MGLRNTLPIQMRIGIIEALRDNLEGDQFIIYRNEECWYLIKFLKEKSTAKFDKNRAMRDCYSNFTVEKVCDLKNFKLIHNLHNFGVVEEIVPKTE